MVDGQAFVSRSWSSISRRSASAFQFGGVSCVMNKCAHHGHRPDMVVFFAAVQHFSLVAIEFQARCHVCVFLSVVEGQVVFGLLRSRVMMASSRSRDGVMMAFSRQEIETRSRLDRLGGTPR